MHNTVFNTLNNEQLVSFFENSGCTKTNFEHGKSIYENATLARAAEIATEDELIMCEEQVLSIQQRIRDEYTSFSMAARECFGRDALEMLGLQKTLPRSIKNCCESASKSFLRVKEHPELASYLSRNGFDENKISSALSLTEQYERLLKRIETLRSDLLNSKKECEQSFKLVQEWLREFASQNVLALQNQASLLEPLDVELNTLVSFADTNRDAA
jgi:uncharacterized alpha-E superfamily protein